VRRTFTGHFGPPAPRVAFAPGRVNLIGEHTDYNEGFVFPMAITRGVAIAFRPREDRRLRGYATSFGEWRDAALDGLAPGSVTGWLGYVAGVAWVLESTGARLPGMDFVIDSDLPVGAGLSSSAALEVATARAFADAAPLTWEPVPMAARCRRAENEFVGVPCGLMDQFASAASRQGCATILDCRTLETEPVQLPRDAVVAVMDTGVRRELARSAYQDRRVACEAAVATLRSVFPAVKALRDVNGEMLERVKPSLDPVVYRRVRHVVEENLRPHALAAAFRAGDLPVAGRLMNDSHASLRDLYQVSSTELDRLTGQAQAHPACFGARMTGAGFGGCAVALVRRDEADAFLAAVRTAYGEGASAGDAWFVTPPAEGAHIEAA
jgi:galactokinase